MDNNLVANLTGLCALKQQWMSAMYRVERVIKEWRTLEIVEMPPNMLPANRLSVAINIRSV